MGAVVVKEAVRRAVAGVVVGNWVVILVEAEIVHIEAEVDIQAAVAVVVGNGGVGEGSLGRAREAEGVAPKRESAIALVDEEQGAGGAHDEQILEAAIVEIGEESARGIVEDADTGFLGDVFEGAVAAIAVEAVGQSGWLTDIEIVKAVVVVVAGRDTVVAIDVDADGAIEDGSPVVSAVEELVAVRRSAAQR